MLPLNSLMSKSECLLVHRLVRMWPFSPLNGLGIKSASTTASLGLLAPLLVWATWVMACAYRAKSLRRARERSASCPIGDANGELQADPPYCQRCRRIAPHFDAWLYRYLSSKGIRLGSSERLTKEDALDIHRLITLHGSPIMRMHLPTLPCQIDASLPHPTSRPVEVRLTSQRGALYTEAKSDLVLHCQCPGRIARECGGHLYSTDWEHPSGEEVSGADAEEEEEEENNWSRTGSLRSAAVSLPSAASQEGGQSGSAARQEQQDEDMTEAGSIAGSEELVLTVFQPGRSPTVDELVALRPFGITRMVQFDPDDMVGAFGLTHPNGYRGALAARSERTYEGDGSVRRNEAALLAWCRSWDGGQTIPIQAANLSEIEVQNWFQSLTNYSDEEGLQTPPPGVHLPDFEMIPPREKELSRSAALS